MIRSSVYRLHPGTLRRAQLLSGIAGANRYVWNWAIRQNRDAMEAYREGKGKIPSFSFFSLSLEFTKLRNSEGHEWLKELPCAEVRYVLKRYADAMKQSVQGKGGFPNWKHKEDGDSFTIPQGVQIVNGRLHVRKVGWVPISRRGGDPWAYGEAKQAVVVKRPDGKWEVSVFWEVPDAKVVDNGLVVGVDMNAGQVAISEGYILRGPDLKRLEARKKRYQRMMNRRKRVPVLDRNGKPKHNEEGNIVKRNSRRRAKARQLLAKTNYRIAAKRKNWLHHVSCNLAENFGTICIEDIAIKNLTASAKGTAEQPGRHVKQKASLNRTVLATGWGLLKWMLEYKAHQVVKVKPAYTSQRCHECGHTVRENRPTQAEFKCVSCGYQGNADINAALNILALGTDAAGQGGAFASVRAGPLGAGLSSNPEDLSINMQSAQG